MTSQTDKRAVTIAELNNLRANYIQFLTEADLSSMSFLHAHNWRHPQEVIDKGVAYRDEIERLEKELATIYKSETPKSETCPTCGSPVLVEGHTTKHYVRVGAIEPQETEEEHSQIIKADALLQEVDQSRYTKSYREGLYEGAYRGIKWCEEHQRERQAAVEPTPQESENWKFLINEVRKESERKGMILFKAIKLIQRACPLIEADEYASGKGETVHSRLAKDIRAFLNESSNQ